jgi:hypothetical protein
MQNLGKNVEIQVAASASAAGTSAVTSAAIDLQGYEGVMVLVKFGAIVSGAVTSIKLQQSSDDGGSDAYSDLEGTSQTVADDDDNLVFAIDCYQPSKRYIKCVVTKATQNSTVESILAIKYGPREKPVTQGATVGGIETHASPAEGTA